MANSTPHIFRHGIVNDLAFAIFGPELLAQSQTLVLQFSPQRKLWLEQLDQDPSLLEQQLNPNQRLGFYYEDLWAFFFKQDPQFELLAQNLTVYAEKTTVGEFDFIVYDKLQNRHLHLEVAIKFYLQANFHWSLKASDAENWIGPNSQDNLQKKSQHLQNKQSRLSHNPQAQQLIKTMGIERLDRCVSLKGYLFSQDTRSPGPEDFVLQKIYRYCYFDELLQQSPAIQYYLIAKQQWIAQQHNVEELEVISLSAIQQLLDDKLSPIMLLAVNSYEATASMQNQRLFVCPSCWPYSLIKPFKHLGC